MKKVKLTKEFIQSWYLNEIKKNNQFYDKYQEDILCNPENYLFDKPNVTAGAPGFGKTELQILKLAFILQHHNLFFSHIPKKAIIIPSDNNVLKSNFYKRFIKYYPELVYKADSPKELLDWDNHWYKTKPICICLPVMLSNASEKMGDIGFLTLDEAQNWYFAKPDRKKGRNTIQNIIFNLNPISQDLLTGSPFKYTARKNDFFINYISTEQMRKENRAAKVNIEVANTSIKISKGNYGTLYGDLKEDTFDIVSNRKVVRDLCKHIIKTIKLPSYAKEWYSINRLTDKALYLLKNTPDKSIIFCSGISQANDWYNIFINSNFLDKNDILISHSQNDPDSENFEKFQNGEAKVLIAVDRGQLGYNDSKLVNVIDATFSWNPERVQQMMNRAVRPDTEIPNKYFIKLASVGMAYFVKQFMTGVCWLCTTEGYTTYTGKPGRLPVLVPNNNKKGGGNGGKRKTNNNQQRLDFLNDFDQINLDADIWTTRSLKTDDVLNSFAVSSLDVVINAAFGLGTPKVNKFLGVDWDIKENHTDYHKYTSITDYTENYCFSAGKAVSKNGWKKEFWPNGGKRVMSEEHKAKIQAKKSTQEAKQKQSKAILGRKKGPMSEEQKRKISEANKNSWRDPNKYNTRNMVLVNKQN